MFGNTSSADRCEGEGQGGVGAEHQVALTVGCGVLPRTKLMPLFCQEIVLVGKCVAFVWSMLVLARWKILDAEKVSSVM